MDRFEGLHAWLMARVPAKTAAAAAGVALSTARRELQRLKSDGLLGDGARAAVRGTARRKELKAA
jgi:hypothetical protein